MTRIAEKAEGMPETTGKRNNYWDDRNNNWND